METSYNGPTILTFLLRHLVTNVSFKFKSNLFDLEMHMLHLLVTHILLPRSGSYTIFTYFDITLKLHIMHKYTLDLSFMMLAYMCFSTSHPTL